MHTCNELFYSFMPQTVGANIARAARVADAFAYADSNAKATSKLREQTHNNGV
jgi:hypothetical protein